MKKCNACHADVDDDVEKCPMCGNDDFQSDDVEEMQEIPEGAKKAIKAIFAVSSIFSLIIAIVVCGAFISFGVMVLKETGLFEGKFSAEAIFGLVFMGFGIFALVSMIRSFLVNREKIKEIDDDDGLWYCSFDCWHCC